MLIKLNLLPSMTQRKNKTQSFGNAERFYRAAVHQPNVKKYLPTSANEIFEAIDKSPQEFLKEEGLLSEILSEVSKRYSRQTNLGSREAKNLTDSLLHAMNRFTTVAKLNANEEKYKGLYSLYSSKIKDLEGTRY